MDNCNVASVGESTYELFKSVDYVATLTGTVAVEAILSDKKVWLLSNSIPYFFKTGINMSLLAATNPQKKNIVMSVPKALKFVFFTNGGLNYCPNYNKSNN